MSPNEKKYTKSKLHKELKINNNNILLLYLLTMKLRDSFGLDNIHKENRLHVCYYRHCVLNSTEFDLNYIDRTENKPNFLLKSTWNVLLSNKSANFPLLDIHGILVTCLFYYLYIYIFFTFIYGTWCLVKFFYFYHFCLFCKWQLFLYSFYRKAHSFKGFFFFFFHRL